MVMSKAPDDVLCPGSVKVSDDNCQQAMTLVLDKDRLLPYNSERTSSKAEEADPY
jgi:hypothetical protein